MFKMLERKRDQDELPLLAGGDVFNTYDMFSRVCDIFVNAVENTNSSCFLLIKSGTKCEIWH